MSIGVLVVRTSNFKIFLRSYKISLLTVGKKKPTKRRKIPINILKKVPHKVPSVQQPNFRSLSMPDETGDRRSISRTQS